MKKRTRIKITSLKLFNPTPPAPEYSLESSRVEKMAENYDLAIVTIGREAGENLDRNREDFALTAHELQLIESSTHRK